MMKARNIENGLALVGAIVDLIGVSFAADNALAEESAKVTTAAVVLHDDAADDTLSSAEKANVETAAVAAASLARENWIDLEIQLEDRTSTLVARGD
jgi:hypothetical protein